MPLIKYNGGFLRAPGGGFARTLDCCCGEPADCCCNCDLTDASITDLDITDGGTRYRLFGGPYSLAEGCTWIIGIQVHGSGTAAGTLILNYCQTNEGGWWLQGFNSPDPYIETVDGPCTGQVDVTRAGVTGFITIEGGRPCPEFE
jgi:hypothetical protein